MTTRLLIRRCSGAILLASPFVALTIVESSRIGIIPMLIIFGITALVTGIIGLGVKLLFN